MQIQSKSNSKLPYFTAALISQSQRWEHIRLLIPFEDLRWLNRPFPLLRDLTFGPTHNYNSAIDSAIMVFCDAPQLKNVFLGPAFYPSRVVLPWSQLSSIDADSIIPADAADIMREATVLVNFRCSLWAFVSRPPRAVPALVHLKSLSIRDGEPSFYDVQKLLLDALTTPALRHLIVSERELGSEPISVIASLISRSHCSLESLRVTHSFLPEADYRAAFPAIGVIEFPRT
jgi:hypothetical protein